MFWLTSCWEGGWGGGGVTSDPVILACGEYSLMLVRSCAGLMRGTGWGCPGLNARDKSRSRGRSRISANVEGPEEQARLTLVRCTSPATPTSPEARAVIARSLRNKVKWYVNTHHCRYIASLQLWPGLRTDQPGAVSIWGQRLGKGLVVVWGGQRKLL